MRRGSTFRRLEEATGPFCQQHLRKELAMIPLEFAGECICVHVQLCEERETMVHDLFVLMSSDMLQTETRHFSKQGLDAENNVPSGNERIKDDAAVRLGRVVADFLYSKGARAGFLARQRVDEAHNVGG